MSGMLTKNDAPFGARYLARRAIAIADNGGDCLPFRSIQ